MSIEVVVIILIGVFNGVLTSKILFQKGFIEKYMETSLKARYWKYFLGENRAPKIIKFVFAPIGLLLSIIIFIWGITLLIG